MPTGARFAVQCDVVEHRYWDGWQLGFHGKRRSRDRLPDRDTCDPGRTALASLGGSPSNPLLGTMLPAMPPPRFMLVVFGRPGDTQALLSAYDLTRASKPLVEAINAELGGLARDGAKQMVRAAAEKILRRHGLVGPDAGGWYSMRSE